MHTVKRSSLPLGMQGSVCSSPRLRGETLSSSGTTSTGALGLSPQLLCSWRALTTCSASPPLSFTSFRGLRGSVLAALSFSGLATRCHPQPARHRAPLLGSGRGSPPRGVRAVCSAFIPCPLSVASLPTLFLSPLLSLPPLPRLL